jgi:hypothetical protein
MSATLGGRRVRAAAEFERQCGERQCGERSDRLARIAITPSRGAQWLQAAADDVEDDAECALTLGLWQGA